MMQQFITLKELAEEMGIDRSHARRWILYQGFVFQKIRDQKSGQLVNVLSENDAKKAIDLRNEQGFGNDTISVNDNKGYFYLIQLIPELDPSRVKIGFAVNVEQRLASHRTSAPTALLLHKWSCNRKWEQTIIDSITRIDCEALSNEVYQVKDVDELIERCNKLFALMP